MSGPPAGPAPVIDGEPPIPLPRERPRWIKILRIVLVLLAVGVAIGGLASYSHRLGPDLHRLSIPAVLLAAAAVLLGVLATTQSWRAILADLGSPLPFVVAARILLVSQVGKYLPGSVWPYLAQMEAGRAHGVPPRRMASAGFVTIVVGVDSGLAVAAATLPVFSPDVRHHYGILLAAAPLLLATLHPRVLTALLALASKLTRRAGDVPQLTLRGMGAAVGWALLAWALNGTQIYVLAHDLGAHGARAIPISIGAFALGWAIGFLVIISPAGAGAREAALVLGLAPVLDRPAALVVALVSRALTTASDLIYAVIAGVRLPRSRRPPATKDDAAPLEPANTAGP